MKVQLENGVWLAEWEGDPGRTLIERQAKEFPNTDDALAALAKARTYHPFPDAVVADEMF